MEDGKEKKLPIHGADALGWFLLGVYAALSVLWWVFRAAAFQFAAWPVLLVFLLRFFSRSPFRRRENDWFLAPFRGAVLTFFRIRDTEHVYFRCPACARILRVEAKPGTRDVHCPRCGALFSFCVRGAGKEKNGRF